MGGPIPKGCPVEYIPYVVLFMEGNTQSTAAEKGNEDNNDN